jgi:hypothetical protein
MNPYIFDPKTSPAKFTPPRTIEEHLEWARSVDEWIRQRDLNYLLADEALLNDQPSREG